MTKKRPQLDPDFIADHRRWRMLRGLARLCAERGYRATTVADICREARISRNSFYEQFAGKEDCFHALVDEAAAHLLGSSKSARSAEPGTACHREGLCAALYWVAREELLARSLLVDAPTANARAFEVQMQTLGRIADRLRDFGPASDGRDDRTEEMVVGGIAAVVRRLLIREEGARAPELQDELCGFLDLHLNCPSSFP